MKYCCHLAIICHGEMNERVQRQQYDNDDDDVMMMLTKKGK